MNLFLESMIFYGVNMSWLKVWVPAFKQKLGTTIAKVTKTNNHLNICILKFCRKLLMFTEWKLKSN